MSLTSEFVAKTNLPEVFGARLDWTKSGDEFVVLEHPAALARFIAFVKAHAEFDADVYLRGQDLEYARLIPALFRGASPVECQRRAEAYREALVRLQKTLSYGRFRRGNDGALFQHYGVKTPWIDLVDNIYTALWFAGHSHKKDDQGRSYYLRSVSKFGWLYLVANRTDRNYLECVDLRKHQSSMSVRPQAQHGLFASGRSDSDPNPMTQFDYGEFVLARIRFPNSARFRVSGTLSSTRFLFPPADIDESFRILLDPRVNSVLQRTERDYHLGENTLGRIGRIRYRLSGRKKSITRTHS